MRRTRSLIVVYILWLFFFFNLERPDISGETPINMASFVYVLAALIAAGVMIAPFLKRLDLLWLNVIIAATYLGLKLALRSPLWGTHIPLTVTELGGVIITALLARRIGAFLDEFESAVENITIDQVGMRVLSEPEGRESMRKELRRARRYNRRLTLLLLDVDESSVQAALHRMVQEVQQAMMTRYVLVGMAKTLNANLRESDLIVQNDGRFWLLLPETSLSQTPILVDRLREAMRARMGVEFRARVVGFPDQATTLGELMRLAEQRLETEAEGE